MGKFKELEILYQDIKKYIAQNQFHSTEQLISEICDIFDLDKKGMTFECVNGVPSYTIKLPGHIDFVPVTITLENNWEIRCDVHREGCNN